MSQPPVLPEPTAADSEAGGVEVVWEGTLEQGLAWMMATSFPPLSLYPAERAVLEGAVAGGAARTLSDLVTRLLELALPAPRRRR